MSFEERLAGQLDDCRQQHRYRQRPKLELGQSVRITINDKTYHNFSSNDYLGLAQHPNVIKANTQAAQTYGCGSGASHLVSGHQTVHHELELKLAQFLQRERALLFSTGYMANLAVLSTFAKKNDRIYHDKLNHASLIDGVLLSKASHYRFRHCDYDQLSALLQRDQYQPGQAFIVVDGVFSMDGDIANLKRLSDIARHYNACLLVDDAHGFGLLGETGAGSVEHFGLSSDQVPVVIGTLGKAAGSFGAFVAGSAVMIESLIQFARPYIYTTALPPTVVAASLEAVKLMQSEPIHRQTLHQRIRQFKQLARDYELSLMPSSTAIQPLIIGSSEKTMAVSEALKAKGFWVGSIRPPTVPIDTARLRITLSSAHDPSTISLLVESLAQAIYET